MITVKSVLKVSIAMKAVLDLFHAEKDILAQQAHQEHMLALQEIIVMHCKVTKHNVKQDLPVQVTECIPMRNVKMDHTVQLVVLIQESAHQELEQLSDQTMIILM